MQLADCWAVNRDGGWDLGGVLGSCSLVVAFVCVVYYLFGLQEKKGSIYNSKRLTGRL